MPEPTIVYTSGETKRDSCPDWSRKAPANLKAKEFVERYILSKNAVQSATGLYKNPHDASNRLLKNPTIKAYIERRTHENLERIRGSKDDLLLLVDQELKTAKSTGDRLKAIRLKAEIQGYLKPDEKEKGVSIHDLLGKAASLFTQSTQPAEVMKETGAQTTSATQEPPENA
jgi:hypothetical protein